MCCVLKRGEALAQLLCPNQLCCVRTSFAHLKGAAVFASGPELLRPQSDTAVSAM